MWIENSRPRSEDRFRAARTSTPEHRQEHQVLERLKLWKFEIEGLLDLDIIAPVNRSMGETAFGPARSCVRHSQQQQRSEMTDASRSAIRVSLSSFTSTCWLLVVSWLTFAHTRDGYNAMLLLHGRASCQALSGVSQADLLAWAQTYWIIPAGMLALYFYGRFHFNSPDYAIDFGNRDAPGEPIGLRLITPAPPIFTTSRARYNRFARRYVALLELAFIAIVFFPSLVAEALAC
ncbi:MULTISPECIES: hypothetical protein [unclassified Bradyrhizobium]